MCNSCSLETTGGLWNTQWEPLLRWIVWESSISEQHDVTVNKYK